MNSPSTEKITEKEKLKKNAKTYFGEWIDDKAINDNGDLFRRSTLGAWYI